MNVDNVNVKKLKAGLYEMRTPDGVRVFVRRFPKKGTQHVVMGEGATTSWRGDAWHAYWSRRDAGRGKRVPAYASSLRRMRERMAERYATEQEIVAEGVEYEGLELEDILEDVVAGKTLMDKVVENVEWLLHRELLLLPGWNVVTSAAEEHYGDFDSKTDATMPYGFGFSIYADMDTVVAHGRVHADLQPYPVEEWKDEDLTEASLVRLEVVFDAEEARTLLDARNAAAVKLAAV